MEKNILENYEVSQKGIHKLTENWFNNYIKPEDFNEICSQVFVILNKDINFAASINTSPVKCMGLIATMCYRLANFLFHSNYIAEKDKSCVCKFMDDVAAKTTIQIHPAAKIGERFFISGHNLIIGETCEIGSGCQIYGNVILGSTNTKKKEKKKHPTLKDNVTIGYNARVLGNVVVGENCNISPYCVVLDDVPNNTTVTIVNQLQISTGVNTLPSQKVVLYAIVPKFKNTFIIHGEGFYNPTVLIKLKDEKQLSYQIDYWDKNKIIIKLKTTTPLTHEQASKAKVIILSNADKVIVTQSFGLIKALITLTN